MRKLSKKRIDLIDSLVAESDIGNLTASLLEKDEHLTDALHVIFEQKFEYATLVFCGGTSLSKAYGLIQRMSEDADIKVVLSEETITWTQNKLRRYLGDEIRLLIQSALEDIGLSEEKELRRSLNNNRYIHSEWTYMRAYGGLTALRPNLQIELVARSPVISPEIATLKSLTNQLLG